MQSFEFKSISIWAQYIIKFMPGKKKNELKPEIIISKGFQLTTTMKQESFH